MIFRRDAAELSDNQSWVKFRGKKHYFEILFTSSRNFYGLGEMIFLIGKVNLGESNIFLATGVNLEMKLCVTPRVTFGRVDLLINLFY